MESITLSATDISCEHCQHAIESAVGAINGVDSVSVDIPAKTVLAAFDPGITSVANITAAMEEEGYPATVLTLSEANAGA
jgi:copper chaperone CopZ